MTECKKIILILDSVRMYLISYWLLLLTSLLNMMLSSRKNFPFPVCLKILPIISGMLFSSARERLRDKWGLIFDLQAPWKELYKPVSEAGNEAVQRKGFLRGWWDTQMWHVTRDGSPDNLHLSRNPPWLRMVWRWLSTSSPGKPRFEIYIISISSFL